MQVKREQPAPTKTKLHIVAEPKELSEAKQAVIKRLSDNVKVPGFRPGKAPLPVIEKHLDPNVLQSEFLNFMINFLYTDAVGQTGLRPVAQPEVAVTKFVPFSALEVTVEVETVGEIKLTDYKKIKIKAQPVTVSNEEVTRIVDDLRLRAATRKSVERAAKEGDEVNIDFKGVDAKTKEAISAADGSDYSLVLGSKNFIPGFEEELIGVKAANEKTFSITFPKDYGATEMQGRKVSFTVKINKVQELAQPKADDAFAATIGPFKTMTELKADIQKQLTAEKQQEAQRQFDNEILENIATKSTVTIPDTLIEAEIEAMEAEEKRNIAYRGQTWQEHLEAEGLNAEEHRAKQRPNAELRVKGGLVLGEIAEHERIEVTPEELEVRLQLLKGQYNNDPAMQAELDKPENSRDIHSRLLTEKTLAKLREYAQA